LKRLLILLVLCSSAWALPAFVQAGNCSAAAATCNVTLGSNTTATDQLTIVVNGVHADAASVSTGAGDSFSTIVAAFGVANTGDMTVFQTLSEVGGTTTVTCNVASAVKTVCVVMETSGASTLDLHPAGLNSATSTSWTTTTYTSAQSSEILMACFATDGGAVTSYSSPVIGGQVATINANASNTSTGRAAVCQYYVASAIQTSQVGTVTVGTTETSNSVIISMYQAGGAAGGSKEVGPGKDIGPGKNL